MRSARFCVGDAQPGQGRTKLWPGAAARRPTLPSGRGRFAFWSTWELSGFDGSSRSGMLRSIRTGAGGRGISAPFSGVLTAMVAELRLTVSKAQVPPPPPVPAEIEAQLRTGATDPEREPGFPWRPPPTTGTGITRRRAKGYGRFFAGTWRGLGSMGAAGADGP